MQLLSVQFLLFFTRFFLTAFHSGPIVTGTSVLAIKFNDGVMLAADCLGMFYSYFLLLTASVIWLSCSVQGRPENSVYW